MVRAGQISMEYLLIVGFAFFLLIPIILIAYTQSARFSGDVTAAQIQKVGNELIDAVNAVHYAGPPSKRTIRLYFPDNIDAVEIDDNLLVFTVQGAGGAYEYALFAVGNMTGEVGAYQGVHVITVEALEGEVNVTES